MSDDVRRAATARSFLRIRALRLTAFPGEIFDEHAWDMLLHLFVATVGGESLSEDELFACAEISGTTGRRWIKYLEADGKIDAHGADDGLALSRAATEDMREFLDRAQDQLVPG